MPDCSYVSIRIDVGDTGYDGYTIEAVGQAVISAGEHWDGVRQEPFDPNIGVTRQADGLYISEMDDCPWGWGSHNQRAMIDKAEGLGVAGYTIADGGHYTWDPQQSGWAPGLKLERIRLCTQEGEPLLTKWELDEALQSCYPSFGGLAQTLVGHFGSDPHHWL